MKDNKLDTHREQSQNVDSNDGKAVSGILIIPITPTLGDVEVDSRDVKVMQMKKKILLFFSFFYVLIAQYYILSLFFLGISFLLFSLFSSMTSLYTPFLLPLSSIFTNCFCFIFSVQYFLPPSIPTFSLSLFPLSISLSLSLSLSLTLLVSISVDHNQGWGFSVSRYSMEQLERTDHAHELQDEGQVCTPHIQE